MFPESYVYQYFVGGVIFLLGLWLCWRSGDLNLGRAEDRRWLVFAVGGMAAYAIGQGILQFYCAAP